MSKIEWTEKTWNPIVGCSKCSPGCEHCYAERMACRLTRMSQAPDEYKQVVAAQGWNGQTRLVESALDKPLQVKRPTVWFVCSMGDLFHKYNNWEWVVRVFEVMAECPQHTFLVLTKRPHIMRAFMLANPGMLLPNMWVGTTVCNQVEANRKVPSLFRTPAVRRFLSVEPMLGAIDLKRPVPHSCNEERCAMHGVCPPWMIQEVDQVIVGGESGPGARPMHPEWVRSLRDQCLNAGTPFFFKQWGEYAPIEEVPVPLSKVRSHFISLSQDGQLLDHCGGACMWRCGKKQAGRALDGVVHDDLVWAENGAGNAGQKWPATVTARHGNREGGEA